MYGLRAAFNGPQGLRGKETGGKTVPAELPAERGGAFRMNGGTAFGQHSQNVYNPVLVRENELDYNTLSGRESGPERRLA